MYRFSEVNYDADAQAVEIGAGLIWDDVYASLAPFNVSVVGGRVTGVGVAGFILGGGLCFLIIVSRPFLMRSLGYSWKTNQYGLTIDTLLSYELVLPNGTVTTVTADSNPDLFFSLKVSFIQLLVTFYLTTLPLRAVGITLYANNLILMSGAS